MSGPFKAAVDHPTAPVRTSSAGSGKPLFVLQADGDSGATAFHELLAQSCEVTLVASTGRKAFTVDSLAEVIHALKSENCTVMCKAGDARAALDLALREPDAIGQLVLEAPQTAADLAYRGIETPVLIVESSKATERTAGQALAGVVPRSYHVLVYDAPAASPTDRAEAAAEVVADFVERGSSFVLSKSQPALYP